MTAIYTKQYRPLANVSLVNQPVSVHDVAVTASNLNNAKHYALVTKHISTLFAENLLSDLGSTDENIVLPPMAPRYISPGYIGIRWYLHGALEAGSTGTTTWTLYAHAGLYRGNYALDTTRLAPGYVSSTIEFTSTDPEIKTAMLVLSTTTAPGAGRKCVDGRGMIWYLLTAKNSAADTQCRIEMFDGWPRL